ncbi:MAG: DUF707 domain-containing protein [Chloroflexi bacterium]|nr:DUF707 domain-containing protein [Chloroflexota bacterium]
MEFTGERYIPQLDTPEISYEHWHRYLYASHLVKGKKILDIACGEGYGSYLLAQTAKHVVGVDISVDAINHATSTYNRKNLEFKSGSLVHIPIEKKTVFDGIVSFESVEHISQDSQEIFLKEVKRLLKPNGFLLISTPNKLAYSDVTGYKNEFHIKEFYVQEFQNFLGGFFKHIKLLGQRIYPISYIWNYDSKEETNYVEEYRISETPDGFRPTNEQKTPLYILALCSDTEISLPLTSVQVDLSEKILKIQNQKIYQLDTKLNENNQIIKDLRDQIDKQKQLIQSLASQALEKEQAIQVLTAQSLASQITQKGQATLELTNQATEKEQAILALTNQATEKEQAILALTNQATEKEQAILALTNQATEKEQAILALTNQATEKEQAILALTELVIEKERMKVQAEATLAQKDEDLKNISSQIIEIKASTAWRIIQWLWQIRLFFAPSGSRREQLGRLGMRALRVLRNEGLAASIQATLRNFGVVSSPSSVNKNIPSTSEPTTTLIDEQIENPELLDGSNPSLVIENVSSISEPTATLIDEQIESSGLFDGNWYLAQYPEIKDINMNPLQHYLSIGVFQGYNPNPLFNTSIYAKTQGLSPKDALLHFYNSQRLLSPGAYRNTDVLLSVQHAYQTNTKTILIEDRRSDRRRFAVYFQCGSGSLHHQWFYNGPRPWDLIVNHYDDTYVGKIPCEIEFQQVGLLPGTKFTFFSTLLTNWPHYLSGYDYVFLLDDDILISEAEITNLFTIALDHSLDLAQASLSPDSYCAHPVFKNPGTTGLRYVNAVEIMMPILSKRALKTGGHIFSQTISGWGLDVALGQLVMDQLKGKAAVIDDVVAKHIKPIDVDNGSFYRMLHNSLIYPEIELTHLQKIYGVGKSFYEMSND